MYSFSSTSLFLQKKTAVQTCMRALELTREAVLIFDATGHVLLANDRALDLLGKPEDIEGKTMCDLFWNAYDSKLTYDISLPVNFTFSRLRANNSKLTLPFCVDMPSPLCYCGADPMHTHLVEVRCEKISTDQFLVFFSPSSKMLAHTYSTSKYVESLEKANNRLAGTLNIVFNTANIVNIDKLFEIVTKELKQTLQADGALMYVADTNGLYLRGRALSDETMRAPQFILWGCSFDSVVFEGTQTHRMHILDKPEENSQVESASVLLRVLDEETQEVSFFSQYLLPSMESFLTAPIYFNQEPVALIVVGWERYNTLTAQDCSLLDCVAEYLQSQVVGALKALRLSKQERFNRFETRMFERLSLVQSVCDKVFREEITNLSGLMNAQVLCVEFNSENSCSIVLDEEFKREIPYELLDDHIFGFMSSDSQKEPEYPKIINAINDETSDDALAIKRIVFNSQLSQWLCAQGLASHGVYIGIECKQTGSKGYMLVRSEAQEAFTELDLSFIERIVRTLLVAQREELEHVQEKHIAQALQTGMKNVLQTVESIECAGLYSSATADAFVGGDFYDLIALPNNKACVIMGDVSGKGVEAASVSAAVKTALGAYAWTKMNPVQMLDNLNKFLIGFSRIETFASLFVGIIDLTSKELSYCSAGHPPAIYWEANKKSAEFLDVQSPLVGAFDSVIYREGTCNMHEGDMLVLYTDGATEARSKSGDFFGDEALIETVLKHSSESCEDLVQSILTELDRYTQNHLDDDIALLALRIVPSAK